MAKKETSTAGGKVKVLDCTCANVGQDKLHGKGKRVHNPFAKGYRCTVCGKEKLA